MVNKGASLSPTPPPEAAATQRRRRPPSLQEQERRKAWGVEWGKINSEEAKRLREGWD